MNAIPMRRNSFWVRQHSAHSKKRNKNNSLKYNTMTKILKSLDLTATEYTYFEKDQVLTANQLNSVSEYFEDQFRLTRIQLLGVGIICGLKVAVARNTIIVSKGVG